MLEVRATDWWWSVRGRPLFCTVAPDQLAGKVVHAGDGVVIDGDYYMVSAITRGVAYSEFQVRKL